MNNTATNIEKKIAVAINFLYYEFYIGRKLTKI